MDMGWVHPWWGQVGLNYVVSVVGCVGFNDTVMVAFNAPCAFIFSDVRYMLSPVRLSSVCL